MERRGAFLPTLVAMAVATVALLPATAVANNVGAARFEALARTAGQSPPALAALRRVTAVDGVRVDAARALGTARGRTLDSRLRVLALGVAAGHAAGDPARAARRSAASILAASRFHPSQPAQPFRHFLDWLGGLVEPVISALARVVPGGRSAVVVLAAAAFLVLTSLVAVRTTRRRTREHRLQAAGRRGGADAALDPDALEREAAAAERAGELERALRLRFVAGLLRLDAEQALSYRPSLRAGEVAKVIQSPTFDEIASSFDEVVYGGRAADAADIEAARQAWPKVIAEARRT